ncbi:hypothetical protein K1Y80_09635 [Streptomyces sp. MAG02]|nr:hypothetical protein [Streptomyces sp. MAG02]
MSWTIQRDGELLVDDFPTKILPPPTRRRAREPAMMVHQHLIPCRLDQ